MLGYISLPRNRSKNDLGQTLDRPSPAANKKAGARPALGSSAPHHSFPQIAAQTPYLFGQFLDSDPPIQLAASERAYFKVGP
jgi:hypothetical protein